MRRTNEELLESVDRLLEGPGAFGVGQKPATSGNVNEVIRQTEAYIQALESADAYRVAQRLVQDEAAMAELADIDQGTVKRLMKKVRKLGAKAIVKVSTAGAAVKLSNMLSATAAAIAAALALSGDMEAAAYISGMAAGNLVATTGIRQMLEKRARGQVTDDKVAEEIANPLRRALNQEANRAKEALRALQNVRDHNPNG